METDIPSAGEPPLAKIFGIQFGLMTSDDIYKLSVYATDNPVTKTKELADAKLGLPIAKGTCGTCNAETVDQCQGHFAHCLLPTPIFHPNHVGKLVTLLRKICLNCGQPKTKKTGKLPCLFSPALKKQSGRRGTVTPIVEENVSTLTERPQHAGTPHMPVAAEEISDGEDCYQCSLSSKHKKRKHAELFLDTETHFGKRAAEELEAVILLSSDEEDFSSITRKQFKVQSVQSVQTEQSVQKGGDNDEKVSATPVRRSWNFRKIKSPVNSTANNSAAGPFIRLAESHDPSAAKLGKRKRVEKGKDSQPNPVAIDDLFVAKRAAENRKPPRGKCKYCSGARSDSYPDVHLKVEVKERGKDDTLSKAIKMEYKVREKDMESVAADYWSFVEGKSSRHQASSVKRSRLLLPSEALKILKKIPESALERLGMHSKVALPEALIIECVPVPPNCTRIQDDIFGSSNIGFKQGIDRATLIFSKFLNKINGIKQSRYGKPSFVAAGVEASELQSLFGLYLREKGAAKAVPGKEKKRIDHVGRLQKRDSRWSLEWLKRHVLGKRSGYSARNVVTGDPYLRVEEIGIPQQIAKYVTIPDRVNKLNKDKLQECINVGQSLVGRYRACGAVRLIRGGERLEVTRKTSHELQIGDIVHRHLRDGDLVYVNRPPSLHKHSLLALRVYIQDIAVFTINPAVCAPLHADFDGDCLHLFVPQSEEAKAELHQLMTIPEQLLPSPEGKTIIGMSQDNILATHLLTSTPVFLSKEEMHQMGMWSTRTLPIPAIVKSKEQGPMWTGKQVIDLTIPESFSMTSFDGAVDIRDGELLSYKGNENWLTSTSGLMRTLARYSPFAAVNHLDCSQSALREWLLSRGFSVSLGDFYAAPDYQSRRKMIHVLMDNMTEAQNMAVNRELLFDEQYQKLEATLPDRDIVSPEDPKQAEVLEDIAVGFFQQHFSEIGEALGSEISGDNQLLAMVRSGSKGSLSKVLQQIGSLGLQLYKGEHLLNLCSNAKLISLAASMCCEDRWEARGLVRSSLLDGLDPLEFYLHSIAVRAGLLRQSLEVTEPGELFKNLMLFLRDIHISYDGTVRNKCGIEIIQFKYDGVKSSTFEGDASDRKEYVESVMPGEAVGILAATAIAQPAYQVMLEANHNVGSKKIRPLALLQDTIFPRSGTKLKTSDRRTILRLKPCSCEVRHWEEQRALSIKNELQPLSVEMVAKAMIIQYVPEDSSEWTACRDDGVKLRLPWVGHILLDANAMIQIGLKMETVVSVLETSFTSKSYAKVMGSHFLGNSMFFSRSDCVCMGAACNNNESGPCLHFSASLKSRNTNRMASRSNKKVLEFVDALRDVMMPLILKTTVKGDERIESCNLVWEDAAWSPSRVSGDGERILANPKGELVVEVVVQEKFSTTRGSAWSITKEACAPIGCIDWRRSSPYSVQEVRHSLGVEAARDCVLQRLTLATQAAGTSVNNTHLKLVSDLMVHSGEVNGITPFGYRDLLRSLKTSAPFTAGAFRAPIKTFMEAGQKGDEEFLNGVLASSVFGMRVPVGTGADFSLQLQPKVISENLQLHIQSVDIFDRLTDLNSKIKEEFREVAAAVASEDIFTQDPNEWAKANGNGGQRGFPALAGDWGIPDGGISTGAKESDLEEGGWGEPSPAQANDWGASPAKNKGGGWDAPDAGGMEDAGGWGVKYVDVSKGEATKVDNIKSNECGWADSSPAEDLNAWSNLASTNGGARGWAEEDVHSTENVPAANGRGGSASASNGLDTDMTTENEHMNDGWGAAEENPVASNGWDTDELLPDAQGAGGWGPSTPADSPRADRGHDNSRRQLSTCSSRGDDRREFKPTGANTIPLGKMRQFGARVVGAGSDSVSVSHTSLDTALGANDDSGTDDWLKPGKDNDGDRSDGWSKPVRETPESNWEVQERLESNWGSVSTADWDGKEAVSDWALISVQGGGTDSGWAPLDNTKTSTGGLLSPIVHLTPGWSPRWPKETSGNYGQNGRGLTAPRKALDSRKDLEDWKEIVEIVRSVRHILQTYEPEEKLKDEDHHVLMTQVLPHHPSNVAKVGCGVDYFKVAHYKTTKAIDRPTKCFFLVRTDGTQDDFSYHKCLQTLASKKNPPLDDLYATAFIHKK